MLCITVTFSDFMNIFVNEINIGLINDLVTAFKKICILYTLHERLQIAY